MYGTVLISLLFTLVLSTGTEGRSPTVQLYRNTTNTFRGMEGFIQIYVNGSWSFINGSDWDYTDAMVACRELGMEGVADFNSADTTFTIENQGRRTKRFSWISLLPTIIQGIKCIGSERKLSGCAVDAVKSAVGAIGQNFLGPVPGTAMRVQDVGYVSCAGFYPIRLVGGSGRHEGRVEVFFNNSWGTVCDDYWGFKDAQVVCKQMGYPGALSALGDASFGQGSSSEKIWIDDTDCDGNETSLLLCEKGTWGVHNCIHGEDAAVICETWGECLSLPEIANGRMSTYSTDLGDTVTFSCDEGFMLFGARTVTCQYDGTWNGRAPYCVGKGIATSTECPELPEIANGRVMGYTSISIGTEVTFECMPGYVLVGHSHLTCTPQGMWNGMPPICFQSQQNSCPPLPNVEHGTASSTQTSIGTSVSYTCDDGFILLGYNTISCVRMGYLGQWNGSPPMCISAQISRSSALFTGQLAEAPDPNTNNNNNSASNKASIAAAVVFSTLGAIVILALIVIIVAAVLKHKSNKKNEHRQAMSDLGTPLVSKEEGTVTVDDQATFEEFRYALSQNPNKKQLA